MLILPVRMNGARKAARAEHSGFREAECLFHYVYTTKVGAEKHAASQSLLL